jgi:hypothetical protein
VKAFYGPESRSRYLRSNHKEPLRERAIKVLGDDGAEVLQALRAAYSRSGTMSRDEFDAHARMILRYAARVPGRKDRVKYVRTCIRNEIREQELTRWLEEHPDMFDFLTDEEVRNIPKFERDAYNAARTKAASELDQITGVQPGLELQKRVGRDETDRLTTLISDKIDIDTEDGFRRYVSIIRCAAKPTVRHPEKYIKACLRKLRAASKRNRKRDEKPKPTG